MRWGSWRSEWLVISGWWLVKRETLLWLFANLPRAAEAGVGGVAEGFADEVVAGDGHEDGQARELDEPWGAEDGIAA